MVKPAYRVHRRRRGRCGRQRLRRDARLRADTETPVNQAMHALVKLVKTGHASSAMSARSHP